MHCKGSESILFFPLVELQLHHSDNFLGIYAHWSVHTVMLRSCHVEITVINAFASSQHPSHNNTCESQIIQKALNLSKLVLSDTEAKVWG